MKGKWNKTPKNRFQQRENVLKAFEYIESKGIKLTGIQPDAIVDKNMKLTLGLTWSCINKFQIEEISVEEATARDALLLWCKKNTQGYEDVNVTNFTTSWSSGLAFCALINHFRPELLDYNALDRANEPNNCNQAFDACRKLGITVFLDVEDLVGVTPDDKSIVTQVAEFFHFFASESKTIAMADKIKKALSVQKDIERIFSDYEQKARAYVEAVNTEKNSLLAEDYEKTVPGVTTKLVAVIKFGRDSRSKIVDLRGDAIRSWTSLVNQCKSHSRSLPPPPQGLEPESLDKIFEELEETQKTRRVELTELLHKLQKEKIDAFDEKCQNILTNAEQIRGKSQQLEGTLEEKSATLSKLLEEAQALHPASEELKAPCDELIELKLNQRAKNTPYSVQNEVDQLISEIQHLIGQNMNATNEQNNANKIAEYNQKAQFYVDEIAQLDASLVIEGSLADRRTAFLEKQKEISTNRDGIKVLVPVFEKLEQEGLHLEIVNTPDSLENGYGNLLTKAIVETNKIFDEMVVSFDNFAATFLEKIKKIRESGENLSGTFTEQKATIESLINEANAIQSEVSQLDAPYEELCTFNLQSRIKYAPTEISNNVQNLIAFLNKLLEQNKTNLKNEDNERRINEYNELANTFVQTSQEFDSTVKAISGDLVEKRTAFLAKVEELAQKRADLNNLAPAFHDL